MAQTKPTTQKQDEYARLRIAGADCTTAAAAVKVSKQTASTWNKKIPVLIYLNQRETLQSKISHALTHPLATPAELWFLMSSAQMLEEVIKQAIPQAPAPLK